MERSKTCVFVIQAAALAIARGIFDLKKRYFPPHQDSTEIRSRSSQAAVLIEHLVFDLG